MSKILSQREWDAVSCAAVPVDEPFPTATVIDARMKLSDHDAALRAENERLRADYTNACSTIAAMHAAAVGEVRGSTLGVVEEVATVREAANRLLQKTRETYADHRYMNVWATAQERLGPYTGPNWIAEAESLDAALAAPPEEKENHE